GDHLTRESTTFVDVSLTFVLVVNAPRRLKANIGAKNPGLDYVVVPKVQQQARVCVLRSQHSAGHFTLVNYGWPTKARLTP
ncbi:MAG: hypothetical protein LBL95_03580, partial [Deltaproteobacteria bacterium]|nr:hypothetical protein [Deltaproteobacteria bacterium]